MAKMSGGEALAKSLANEGRRGRIRNHGHTDIRYCGRFAGRAKYSHDLYSARTGDDINGRWICPRIRKAGSRPRGSGRGAL